MKKLGALAVFLCVLASSPAWAQVNTAQINGTVSDASGAVVPNAQITVTNPATGFSRTTQSNDTGNFAVALLPPGTYTLKVELQGFQTTLQKDIVLAVGQQLTLNLTLQAGAITQTVEVTGEAPLVELTRSEIAGSVSALEVKELPILDRNFAGLTYIIPGVRPAEGFDPTKTRVGNFTLNGGDGRQTDVNVDGGDNKDNVVGGQIQAFTLEGIQEFNVITNRYTAESGRTIGAIINVVTKSGTNDFHGSVFGLFQVSTFNKKSFFERDPGPDSVLGTGDDCVSAPDDICPGADGVLGTADDQNVAKNKFHRYHFGFSAGGPVIKDKFFAFGAYEQKREPGTIPASPDALTELALVPLALPVGQLPFNYLDHLLTIRLDHQISDRQTMFYRYGRQRWTLPNDQLGAPFFSDGSGGTSNINQFHDLIIGHNYTFAGNKVNSFSFHFQDFVNAISANPLSSFTLAIAGGSTVTNPEVCFLLECGSGLPGVEIGNNINVPQQTLIRKYQVRDDFAWVYGRHNMKVGLNWIYAAKLGGFFAFAGTGYQILFPDAPSTIAATCPTFDCPGLVSQILFTGGESDFKQRPHQLAFYFQDDWKVTPRLTLNLGLRWDANINFLGQHLTGNPLTSDRVALVMRDVIAANPTAPEAQAGMALINHIWGDEGDLRRRTANWKEFAPRLGFAWDPTGEGKHVIRGGYGIVFDQIFQNLTLFGLQLSNPTIYTTVLDCSGPPSAFCPDLTTWRFGVDPLPAPPAFSTDLPLGTSPTVRISHPRLTDPYGQQWSLGWAWEFRPDWAFSVDYYHVLGIHEQRTLNANPRILAICDPAYGGNPANPTCVSGTGTRLLAAAFVAAGLPAGQVGEIRLISSGNRSRYDGANFVLRKRFSHRYMLQANYVLSWSRSWTGVPTASYGGTGIRIAPQNQFNPGQYGPTIFDERQRLVISGVFELPYGIEISPLFQAASARPYPWLADTDLDGDGVGGLDRVCVGSAPTSAVLDPLCQQVDINSLRGDPFAQLDVRFAKAFRFKSERLTLRVLWEFYNLFNTNNFGNNYTGVCGAVVTGDSCDLTSFRQPNGYFGGQGFGGATSGPLRSQFGFRLEW